MALLTLGELMSAEEALQYGLVNRVVAPDELMPLAREMADNGAAEAKIDAMMVPEPYDDWLFAAFFALNMRFLYQRRLGA